jgi:hypothetical protein
MLRLEGLGQLKKFNKHIENRTRDFSDCSIVPQPTELPSETLFLNKYVQIVNNCTFKLAKVIATTEPRFGKTDATVGMLKLSVTSKRQGNKGQYFITPICVSYLALLF